VARRADRLEALAQRLREQHGVSARLLIADLSEDGGIDALTSLIQSESELGVLVNDAGGPFVEISPERIDRLLEIHCRATTPPTRAALPGMISSGRGDRCSTTPAPPSTIRTSSRGPHWPREQAGRRCKTSGGAVKDQVELCKASAGADPESISRSRTIDGGPPGTRTPNLRIKSPLLCQIELEAQRSLASGPEALRVTEGT
jgi:NAD(P)-dependent dehydrogenase (short-subunit alcohol dehydrogenase family)